MRAMAFSDLANVPSPPLSEPLLSWLRNGFDIALDYLNSDGSHSSVANIRDRAMSWSFNYYTEGQTRACSKNQDTFVLRVANNPRFKDIYPDIFNLNVPAPQRFKTVEPSPSMETLPRRPRCHRTSDHPEQPTPIPEDMRAPEESVQREKFPEYVEPTPAAGSQLDEIIDLRPQQNNRRPHITAEDLRPSALMTELPEFIAQLAKANMELETDIAEAKKKGEKSKHVLELSSDDNTDPDNEDKEHGPSGQHIELDIMAGVLKRQHQNKSHGDQNHDDEDSSKNDNTGGNESSASNSSTRSVRKLIIRRGGVRIGSVTTSKNSNSSGHESSSSNSSTGSVKKLIVCRGGVRIGSVVVSPPRPQKRGRSDDNEDMAPEDNNGKVNERPAKRARAESCGAASTSSSESDTSSSEEDSDEDEEIDDGKEAADTSSSEEEDSDEDEEMDDGEEADDEGEDDEEDGLVIPHEARMPVVPKGSRSGMGKVLIQEIE